MMIWVRLLRGWGAPGAPLEVRLLHPLVRLVRGVRYLRGVRHLHHLPCSGGDRQVPWSGRNCPA